MALLDRLEDRFGRYGVPHVTLALILGQAVAYVVAQAPAPPGADPFLERLGLVPDKVLAGEVWRLATFLIIPPFTNILFAFFFWYLFYLMGTALEHYWGAFRYNVFLLIGYAATLAAAFLVPDQLATNGYLQGSVFLAFAYLYPDFELYLFFILPVRIKWLALLTWIGYGLVLATGDWPDRALVLASIANFLIFSGVDLYLRMRSARWWMARQAQRFAEQDKPFHRCTVCGITDRSHPHMDFRYCSQCDGARGYCMDHLHDHPHITGEAGAAGKS